MTEQLLIASNNPKKLKELRELLSDFPVELHLLSDFPGVQEIEEDGLSFRENAEKKALGFAKQTGLLAVADDSGLCVDSLAGAPGIYSARYAGPGKDDLKNCEKLLRELKNVPDAKRTASFRCAAALANPEQVIAVIEERVEGLIARTMQGTGGFGYDPLFFYPDFGTTFAEVPAEKKHSVSHRGKALRRMKEILAEHFQNYRSSKKGV